MTRKPKVSLAAAAGQSPEEAFVAAAHDATPTPKDKEARLNVVLAPKQLTALKVRAAQKGTTIRKIILSLIEEELARP